MQTQKTFGRRSAPSGAGKSEMQQTLDYAEAYRELRAGLDDKREQASLVNTLFGGARGAVIALGGCTAMLGLFFMIYLRGFARLADGNLTKLMIGGAILVLVLPRLVAFMKPKK